MDVLRLVVVSARDWVLGAACCCSNGSGPAELSVRLDLSMDFGTLAFSFSVVGDSMTSTSTSEAEEMARAACEAVRRRATAPGDST